MVAPAAAAAAGWTVEEIGAAVGIVGTVGGGVGQFAGSGGTGWNFSGPSGNVHYPKEVGPDRFYGELNQRGGTLVRFFADGGIWNNECLVYFHGIFSMSSDPLVAYHEHAQNHPANRYLEVGFSKGGEELTSGLLSCGLSVYETGVEGPVDDPKLIVHLGGKFDPLGPGDADYGFNVYIDTFGRVSLGQVEINPQNLRITMEGDHVEVYMFQAL